MTSALAQLLAAWRARAEQLAPYAPAAAEAFRAASRELEAAERQHDDELLDLTAAAKESGYSDRALRAKLAAGEIPQHGRKGAPRIRRADLPKKLTARLTAPTSYDAAADARALVRRA